MKSSIRLLILDDDREVAETLAEMAAALGCEIAVTTSPKEMFVLMDEWRPSHIALDLVMPGMDGVEVLRDLARFKCKASIILTSGMGLKVLDTARNAGIRRGLTIGGILPKPFAFDSLRPLFSSSLADPAPRTSADRADDQIDYAVEDMIDAFHSNQFLLHYQPKIRLDDSSIVGFEALIRWEHPRHGMVYPARFIAQLEGSAMMYKVTCEMFDVGLRWLNLLGKEAGVSLSMNISAGIIEESDLVDRLYWSCLKHDISMQRVILEITESSAVQESAAALDALSRLRIKGFGLSIDDFGTGYSTMTQLSQLPFTELKIDRTFVATMQSSHESLSIVQSTIDLGHRLDMLTTAEGVEDESTMRALHELGCDLAQGYFFARPMPGPQALKHFRDWHSEGNA